MSEPSEEAQERAAVLADAQRLLDHMNVRSARIAQEQAAIAFQRIMDERGAWQRAADEVARKYAAQAEAAMKVADQAVDRVRALEAKCDLLSASLKQADERAVVAERSELVVAQALWDLRDGKEHVQCLVARYGEMTIECPVGDPCAACRAAERMKTQQQSAEAAENALHCLIEEVRAWDRWQTNRGSLGAILDKYRKGGGS